MRKVIAEWLKTKQLRPAPFQKEVWQLQRKGYSGLVCAPTGSGKTYAAYLEALAKLSTSPLARAKGGLGILYVTPLRALARDVELALSAPLEALSEDCQSAIRIESRTGDTTASLKKRQQRLLPQVLVTTPESLALLLSYPDQQTRFGRLQTIIVDEWHELLGNKRGVLLELLLSRLRCLAPEACTWGLSATLADPGRAMTRLLGTASDKSDSPIEKEPEANHRTGKLVQYGVIRPLSLRFLWPKAGGRVPWAGHLGLAMLPQVLEELNLDQVTLIFTNTRSQSERWFQAISDARPDWRPQLALHHGSLDKENRAAVESGIKEGRLRLVVCTSTLDLGVDYPEVERIFQIGSPKTLKKLTQRAGRGRHRPGLSGELVVVPTYALEALDFEACKLAVKEGRFEEQYLIEKPYDVLLQHLVTMALGGGFTAEAMHQEVCQAAAYSDLSTEEFNWVLDLAVTGGATLNAYPAYQKIVKNGDEHYKMDDRRISQLHRLNLGTITGDSSIEVKFLRGNRIGRVDESYLTRLNPGDAFLFGGRLLEFVKFYESTAYVKPAKTKDIRTPKWLGGRLPMSETLGQNCRRVLADMATGAKIPETLAPLLKIQTRLSELPRNDEILAELCRTRDGLHLFLYPFEGRLVNEAIALILAARISKLLPGTFSMSANEHGLELVRSAPIDYQSVLQDRALLASENLTTEAIQAINMSEMAKRHFREIARVAGLVYQNYPGRLKSGRQIQTSASLLYDVFDRFEPENLLLRQARREVLDLGFERARLERAFQRLQKATLRFVSVRRPTPFGLPLVIERVSARLSTEDVEKRIERMIRAWETPAASR